MTGPMQLPEPFQTQFARRAAQLLASYRRLLGSDLISGPTIPHRDARRLFDAPFAVLAHGTQADPVLDYANRVALELWELRPEELVVLPSRLTAEPMLQAAREKVLRETAAHGFIRGYEGVRIAKSGRRFLISNVTIWNVTADDGTPAGQAAAFDRWVDA